MNRTQLALSLVVVAAGCAGIVEEQLATGDEAVKSQAIYSDNLHAPWSDLSTATDYSLTSAERVFRGKRSIRYAPRNNDEIAFGRASYAANGYESLGLSVHGGGTGGQQLAVVATFVDRSRGPAQRLDSFIANGTIPANSWATARIPLSALEASGRAIIALSIMDASGTAQAPVWLDEIAFVTGGGTVYDAGMPAPSAPPSVDAGTSNPPASDAGATNPPATDAGATNPPATDAGASNPPAADAGTNSPPASDAGSTPPPPLAGAAPQVRVDGNRIVDQNGRTVRLVGVNRSGTQYACVEGWGFYDGAHDAASVDAMRSWNMNAVRVSLNEHCWLGINGVPAAYSGANYQAEIVRFVNLLNSKGLVVILDLHWNAPGTQKATDQQAMADRDHAPAFWTSVAQTFKDNRSVIFDLYNEPHPDSNRNTAAAWACVRDGGTCPGVPFVAAGMQELVDAVRGAGAMNPIMVGGPQYAGVVDKWIQYKPNDSANQLIASIHIYYWDAANPDWSPCYLQSCWENSMAPLAQTTPIVIGELGEHDCDSGLVMPLLRWADAHGISYLAWSWITGNCAGGPALISNYDGTPSGFGRGVRDHLRSLPTP